MVIKNLYHDTLFENSKIRYFLLEIRDLDFPSIMPPMPPTPKTPPIPISFSTLKTKTKILAMAP
jgi:hypothetical protein